MFEFAIPINRRDFHSLYQTGVIKFQSRDLTLSIIDCYTTIDCSDPQLKNKEVLHRVP